MEALKIRSSLISRIGVVHPIKDVKGKERARISP
jgi:hypothetical protein